MARRSRVLGHYLRNPPVTYDPAHSRDTLRPPTLMAGTTYAATIRSGVDGAKNLAGSPLAADRTWKFTTAPQG